MRDAVLGDPEDRFQIDRDDSFPVRVVGLQYRPIAVFPQNPGIVIEDVQGLKGLNALLHQTFDVGLKMTKVDIPAAFRAFTTVQMLAPVAKYAVGSMSTDLRVNGALGKNMMPLFPALSEDAVDHPVHGPPVGDEGKLQFHPRAADGPVPVPEPVVPATVLDEVTNG